MTTENQTKPVVFYAWGSGKHSFDCPIVDDDGNHVYDRDVHGVQLYTPNGEKQVKTVFKKFKTIVGGRSTGKKMGQTPHCSYVIRPDEDGNFTKQQQEEIRVLEALVKDHHSDVIDEKEFKKKSNPAQYKAEQNMASEISKRDKIIEEMQKKLEAVSYKEEKPKAGKFSLDDKK